MKQDPEASTLSIAVDRGLPPDVLKALKTREEERTPEQSKLVQQHFQWAAPELQPQMIRVARLEAERNRLDAEIPRTLLTERVRPRITRVLARGNFLDESGEIVEPAIPAVFGKIENTRGRTTRLHLANWIAARDNPLTARVFVNRTWRQFFGTGLSKVLEDFGSQGEMPSHPELLDWLAVEFMQPAFKAEGTHAWDVKHLIRTIVSSHTYRQASLSTPQLDEKDPDNRLLARQSRFRVDAEIVRDTALAVSGLLVERLGGPSVRPYQPKGYLAPMNFPKREYSASRGEDLYRRSVYTEWRRTFLHPTLLTFDAPTREECSMNRVNSNTPLQALVMLNDPIFVEASRVFAQKILASGGSSLNEQLDWAFMRALSRTPSQEERGILEGLYKRNLARFRANRGAAQELASVGEAPVAADAAKPELAALTTVARAILNLNETITRN